MFKTMILVVTMGTMYSLLFFVLGWTELWQEWNSAAMWMNLLTILLGGILFFMYDRALSILTPVYRKKRKK